MVIVAVAVVVDGRVDSVYWIQN